MAQDGTATAIRPRHRRDPRGDSLRSGRHRQDGLGRTVGPLSAVQHSRHVPAVAMPAVPAMAPAPAPALVVAVEMPPTRPRDEPVDATAILPWLVVLGFLGLLGMLLTSLT